MIVHQIFAVILNTEIKNIMVCDNYELANQLARMTFGEEAFAVECTQYPCGIGDKYKEGLFYFKDEETVIPRKNTAEEDAMIAAKKAEELEEKLTQAQMALTQIYESMEG